MSRNVRARCFSLQMSNNEELVQKYRVRELVATLDMKKLAAQIDVDILPHILRIIGILSLHMSQDSINIIGELIPTDAVLKNKIAEFALWLHVDHMIREMSDGNCGYAMINDANPLSELLEHCRSIFKRLEEELASLPGHEELFALQNKGQLTDEEARRVNVLLSDVVDHNCLKNFIASNPDTHVQPMLDWAGKVYNDGRPFVAPLLVQLMHGNDIERPKAFANLVVLYALDEKASTTKEENFVPVFEWVEACIAFDKVDIAIPAVLYIFSLDSPQVEDQFFKQLEGQWKAAQK